MKSVTLSKKKASKRKHINEEESAVDALCNLTKIHSPEINVLLNIDDARYTEIKQVLSELTNDQLVNSFFELELNLCRELSQIQYPPTISYIYNPLDYAVNAHCDFLRKYASGGKTILFVGMNPGPFGMAQTGVPFGEINLTKNWLQVYGEIKQPTNQCPNRLIKGFDCNRSEVSGKRFWELFKNVCKTPDVFFANAFVYNMCPLLFLKKSGKNITPADLNATVKKNMNKILFKYLMETIKLFSFTYVIGIGRYAEISIKKTCDLYNLKNLSCSYILHPSPANPETNKGWENIVKKQLKEIGILSLLEKQS